METLLRSESVEVVDRVFCCGKGVKRRERETTRVGFGDRSVHLLCNKFLWDPVSDIKLSF